MGGPGSGRRPSGGGKTKSGKEKSGIKRRWGAATLETKGKGLNTVKKVSAIKYGKFSFRKGGNQRT